MNSYLDIAPEVQDAISDNWPVVALESTILSHGMPYPDNLAFAKEVEDVIRSEGAVPATIAIIDGRLKVGLGGDALNMLCRGEGVGKVSRRDLPVYLALGKNGATTVSTTMIISALAGIRVFATGGIGGVHRGAETTMDISADLHELADTPVAVVCAGAKQILDIGLTLEYLESLGVPVIGLDTNDFPAFYCRKSGYKTDCSAQISEIGEMLRVQDSLGVYGGTLIANPIPEEYAMDFDYMESIIQKALAEADSLGIRGKDSTPFLLGKVKELTDGNSLKSNIALALNNARAAAKIAVAYHAK